MKKWYIVLVWSLLVALLVGPWSVAFAHHGQDEHHGETHHNENVGYPQQGTTTCNVTHQGNHAEDHGSLHGYCGTAGNTTHYVHCWSTDQRHCEDCGTLVDQAENLIICHDHTHYEHDNLHHREVCEDCGYQWDTEAHNPYCLGLDTTECTVCGAQIDVSAVYDKALARLQVKDYAGFTGFASFEGGKFYFENGQQKTECCGVMQVNGIWYALDHGRVMLDSMMIAFDGELFAFDGGSLRTDLNGLAEYDGQKFVFTGGQYQSQACGPYLDPISGKWVFVNCGQFYPVTDLVCYDGRIFYFRGGYLATDFTGTVTDYNGTSFHVVAGQVD